MTKDEIARLARAEALAIWSAQLLHYVVGNLVSMEAIPPGVMSLNINEAEDHLTRLHPHYAADFQGLSEKMHERVAEAVGLVKRERGG